MDDPGCLLAHVVLKSYRPPPSFMEKLQGVIDHERGRKQAPERAKGNSECEYGRFIGYLCHRSEVEVDEFGIGRHQHGYRCGAGQYCMADRC